MNAKWGTRDQITHKKFRLKNKNEELYLRCLMFTYRYDPVETSLIIQEMVGVPVLLQMVDWPGFADSIAFGWCSVLGYKFDIGILALVYENVLWRRFVDVW